MTQKFISGKHWLEPILPSSGFPQHLLDSAENLPQRAGKLSGLLPEQTAVKLAGLMRITNSHYSNLIEGQYTEPAQLSAQALRRNAKELNELAVSHIGA